MCVGMLVVVGNPQVALAEKRHHHAGVFPPFEGEPPEIALSSADRMDLAAGKTLIRHVRAGVDDHALAIIGVDASPETIWSVLLDFDQYPRWVDGLQSCEVYERDGNDYYVSFHYRRWLVGDVIYHVRHTYPGETTGWGTWTLDYRRRSGLDDTVGFWRVEPIPADPDRAIVIYSTRVRLHGWLARWMEDWLVEDTLRTVTAGLKSRAESSERDA